MSEVEIKRRQDYKRNRKKWILIQAIALVIVGLIALSSFVLYDRMNRTYYIEYTENSKVDYKVQYKSNGFFEEEWIESGNSYVTELVNGIQTDFKYTMNMDASDVGFDYSYGVTAQLVISDKTTGDPIFNPTDKLIPDTKGSARRTDSITITESVTVDFQKYNALAYQFITAYGLKNATAMLCVKLNVDVLSRCDEFETNNENSYSTTLVIPLCEDNFSMHTTSSAPSGESKVLACKGAVNTGIFRLIGIVGAVIAALMAIVLIVFIYITRNEDINYSNKVNKILNSYRSFIQQIDGEFDTEGYQIVPIKSFVEMLGIRDTIQSPVLMWENKDETMTQFLIPTNTKLLYVFEIKVDNYDTIYGIYEEERKVVDFQDEKAILIEEDVNMDDLAEAMATPDVILDEIDYVPEEVTEFESTEETPGIEVVGVVWPERRKNNKVYRYDPSGETLQEGDMVLVPTRDAAKDREVIRKAAVATGNHVIDPESHPHALKKIIGVIKRHAEAALTPEVKEDKE